MRNNRAIVAADGTVAINTALTNHNPRNLFFKSGKVGAKDPRFVKENGNVKLKINVSEEEKAMIKVMAESGMTVEKIAAETGRCVSTVCRYKNDGIPDKDRCKRKGRGDRVGKHEAMGMIYMRYILHVPVKEIAVAFDRCAQNVYKHTNPSSVYVVESGVLTR